MWRYLLILVYLVGHPGIFGKGANLNFSAITFQQRIYHYQHRSLCSLCLSLTIAANAKAADFTYQLLAALPNLPNQTAETKLTKAELLSQTADSVVTLKKANEPNPWVRRLSFTTHFIVIHNSQTKGRNRYFIIITTCP